MNRGFLIVAQNNHHNDYINCAEVLCRSIKSCMPQESVTLLTDIQIQNNIFDRVITFPYGDTCIDKVWKLDNDWQVYDASPYEYTIKLEADLYIPRSISHWWDILKNRDLVISTTIRDYNNDISHSNAYRKIFEVNKLPNAYNAITYFKKSATAKQFFNIVKDIFQKWDEYKTILKVSDAEFATTDLVYALAITIMGEENCTLPNFTDMSMIHMKKNIVRGRLEDWTKEFIYEIYPHTLRINTIPQLYPFHYQIKSFADEIKGELYE